MRHNVCDRQYPPSSFDIDMSLMIHGRVNEALMLGTAEQRHAAAAAAVAAVQQQAAPNF